MLLSSTHAATTAFWTSSAGGTYNAASNWNSGVGPAPGPTDTAELDLAATYPITFTATTDVGTFNQTAGDVTLLTNGTAKTYSVGPFNVLGGNLTMGASGAKLEIRAQSVQVGPGGAATVGFGNSLRTSSSTLSVGTSGTGSAALTIDGVGSRVSADTASGAYLIGGASGSTASGTVTVSNNATAAPQGITMTRGTFSVQTGADVTCSGNITLGTQSTVSQPALMSVVGSGSTFLQDVGGLFQIGNSSAAAPANDALLIVSSSGTVTTSSGGVLTVRRSGTVDFTGGNLVMKGGVLVSGGTLKGTTPAALLLPGFAHTFTVDSGGTVNLTGGAPVDLAASGSASGGNQYIVKDAGSTFTTDGTLRVRDGTDFTVQAGGTLNVPAMEVSDTNSSISIATVDGTGATLISGPVSVGVSSAFDLDQFAVKNNAIGTINGSLSVYSGSTSAVVVDSGADLTINGPVLINAGTQSEVGRCYVSGSGSTLTQTGANAMTIGFPTSSSTMFKSSFGGVISTGTGLLTINPSADVGADSASQFNVNGDVLINQNGRLALTSWAAGKTMNIQSLGRCTFGDITLSGNTINVPGFASTLTGGTVALNGGSALNLMGNHVTATFTALNIAANGTAGSFTISDPEGSTVTATSTSTWGSGGGTANVTINNGGNVSFTGAAGLVLASNPNSTANVLIHGYGFGSAKLSVGSLTMQFNTTSGASATLTIEGDSARLDQTASIGNSIGGPSGSGVATINVRDNGTLALGGDLFINPSATLNITAGNVTTGRSLTIPGGKVRLNSGKLSIGTTLLINSPGQLDVGANAMQIRGSDPGTWTGSFYNGVTGLIANGRNGGAWNGAGVITSQTAAINSNLTTLGIAKSSEVKPITGTQTALWAGYTVSAAQTLIMYTYGGDANLDGKINIDDYIRIDQGIAAGLRGWSNGDFNYDGVINIDDYTTVIDANIGNQNDYVFPTSSGVESVVAVPEVGGWGAGLVGVVLAHVTRLRRR